MSKKITDRQGLENFDVLLKNINQQLFVFNKECRVLPEFLETMKGCFPRPIIGENALDILFKWGVPSNDTAGFQEDQDLGMLQDLLETVFLRVTDLDVMIELLPSHIVLSDKTYALCYRYIQSSDTVDNDRILVLMDNITSQKQLENQILIEEERNLMVLKVALDPDGYTQFRKSAESVLPVLSDELKKHYKEVELSTVLRCITVLKSGAEIFEMNEIIQICEQVLIALLEVQKQKGKIRKKQVERLITYSKNINEKLSLLHDKYLADFISDEQLLDHKIYSVTDSKIQNIQTEIVDRLLSEKFEQLESLFEKNYTPFIRHPQLSTIAGQRLERIRKTIWEDIAASSSQEIVKLLEGLKDQPIGLALKKLALITQNLGDRLGKQVEVVISGEKIEVDYHRFEDLFGSMIHLLRNSVEHGLETMEERVFLGKSLEGKIRISIQREGDNLSLCIEDDGKGIDLERVKENLVAKKMVSKKEITKYSEREVLDLMFKVGYSSKELVSGISGHGVGLNAVQKTIEKLGGKLSIKTKKEKGTAFSIEIPVDKPVF